MFAGEALAVRPLGRSGGVDGRAEPSGHPVEGGGVLGAVPQPAGGEGVRGRGRFRRRLGRPAPVAHHLRRLVEAVGHPRRFGEGAGRREQPAGGAAAFRRQPRAPCQIVRQRAVAERGPPRRDAGVAHGHDRHIEGGQSQGRSVEMDEVGAQDAGEVGERRGGPRHLVRRPGGPVEGKAGRQDAGTAVGLGPGQILEGGHRSHQRDRHRQPAPPQAGGEFEAVLPDAAKGVGGHQDVGRGWSHRHPQPASSSESGRGRSSWMSLKRSNCPR